MVACYTFRMMMQTTSPTQTARQVRSVLELSTRHCPARLDQITAAAMPTRHGYLIDVAQFVAEEMDDLEFESELGPVATVVLEAEAHGCRYVVFDERAAINDLFLLFR